MAVRGCARVTGKAGENGQHSGEMGGSSPWTSPSAPECGDTLKGSSGRPASDLGWESYSKAAPGSPSTGSPAGRTPSHGVRLNVQSGQRKGRKNAADPYPSVAVRDRGHWKGVAGSGSDRGAGRGKTARGWKDVRPRVRLESRTVRVSEEPEEHKRDLVDDLKFSCSVRGIRMPS